MAMTRKLIIALAAIAALAASAAVPAAAAPADQPRPRLKAAATVTGDIVRIGDLVSHAGVIANVPIFRSPDLGTTGVVSAAAVVAAVRAHDLIGLDTGDVQEVLVTRASRTIAPQEIEAPIAQALSTQYGLGKPKNLTLSFDYDVQPIQVEPHVTAEPRVRRVTYDPRTTRFDAVVAIPGRRSLRLTGHVTAMEDIVTLARAVARGDTIKQDDVVMARRQRSRTPNDAITDRASVVGLAARHSLQPGRPLRDADLMKPELVHRHEMVTLLYNVPGIRLTVRGRATENGAQGDMVGVLNEQTKRVVHGVVVGPGRVMIGDGGTQIAANGTGVQTTGAVGAAQ
jgi:flagellar basal body P-ring formation protein FlgA